MTMNKNVRFNLGYAIAAIFAVFLIQHLISTANQIAVIPYSEYQQLLRQGKVDTVGISDRTLQGTLKEALPGGQKQFVTTRVDQDVAQELEKYNVRFTGQIESTFLRDLLGEKPVEKVEQTVNEISFRVEGVSAEEADELFG